METRKPSLTALALGIAAISCALGAPAHAQTGETDTTSVFAGDWVTLGAAAALSPSYEGSDDYVISPFPAVQGKLGGIGFSPRPGGVALNLIETPRDARVSFGFGPVARLRFDRHNQITDDVVERLGKRDIAVELGGTASVSLHRITNPYDSLSLSVDVRGDVAGAHNGVVIAPSVTFRSPVSKAAFVALSINAEHVDGKYARYYFDISPADNAATGLPVYSSRRGWKNAGVGLVGAYDLDGELRNGGWAMFGGTGYSRLLGNFSDSPIISERGSADQFFGMIGIGYTF